MQTIIGLFSVVVMIVFVGGVYQLCGRYFIVYNVTQESIRIEVFGAPLIIIPYSCIEEVRRISGLESLRPRIRILRAGNRIIGRVVLVQKSRGFIRSVLLTPDDPDEFVAVVKGRLLVLMRANFMAV